jgi:hypothetical protein
MLTRSHHLQGKTNRFEGDPASIKLLSEETGIGEDRVQPAQRGTRVSGSITFSASALGTIAQLWPVQIRGIRVAVKKAFLI